MTLVCEFLFDFSGKLGQIKRAMEALPTPPSALTTFAIQEQNNG